MSRKSLGLLIRKIRKEKQLSLRGMKEKLGDLGVEMSIVTISHIENGRYQTSRQNLKDLANVLDVSVDLFFAEINQVDDQVGEIIREKPDQVPEFLRTAKNLNDEDWGKLSEFVKNLKKNKK